MNRIKRFLIVTIIFFISSVGHANEMAEPVHTIHSRGRDGHTMARMWSLFDKGYSFVSHDWWDVRKKLEEKGISSEIVYTGEFAVNTQGGIKRDSRYASNIDLTLTMETEHAGLWKNGTFFVYMLSNHDTEKLTGAIVGDSQAVSNIETTRTTRLYEFWYEHTFLDKKFSILLGQHDLNSEFAVTEYGGLYLNSSFGIQPDISANARPSIFSVVAPTVRFKVTPNETFEFLLGVYDGDPGVAEINRSGTRWVLASDQGALIIAEGAYHIGDKGQFKLPGTYKLGVWHNTGEFDDVVDTDASGDPIKRDGNIGGYFIADQMVYREKGDEGLGVFLQIGAAPDYLNEFDFFVGGGFNYHGLIPGRNDDDMGIAIAHFSVGDETYDAGGRRAAETTLEFTYRTQIRPWLAIQPDIQFVFNPGADPSLEDAVIAMTRFEVSF